MQHFICSRCYSLVLTHLEDCLPCHMHPSFSHRLRCCAGAFIFYAISLVSSSYYFPSYQDSFQKVLIYVNILVFPLFHIPGLTLRPLPFWNGFWREWEMTIWFPFSTSGNFPSILCWRDCFSLLCLCYPCQNCMSVALWICFCLSSIYSICLPVSMVVY